MQCSGLHRRPSLLQPPAIPCLPRALHPTLHFVTPASAIARRKMEMYFLHWKTREHQGQGGQLYLRACCVRGAWYLMGFGKGSLQKMVRMSFSPRSPRQWTIKCVALAFPLKISSRLPPATSPEFNSGAGKGRELCGLRRPFKANLAS